MLKTAVIFLGLMTFCLAFLTNAEGQRPGSPAERSFRTWDKDNSGTLTRDELPAGVRQNFDKADRDGNEAITLAEHLAFLQQRQPQNGKPRLPDSVELKSDVPYADSENPRQALDLVMPKQRSSETPLPVIAYIHGGAWKSGNKSGGIGRVLPFVRTGEFVGVSIGYRLTGEAKWPAQIHDCKAAIRWLKAHAEEYNIDPGRICVFGSSAGGHLVAMLGVTGGVEELEGDLGSHADQDSRVAAVIDFFGPTDFLTMNDFPGKMDHDAADSPESLLIGGAIQGHKEKARAACPIQYVTGDDAPILIMHGTKDPLVPYDQSVQFEKALKAVDVNVTLVEVTGAGHGFGGQTIQSRVRQFVEATLLGKDVEVSTEPITP